MTTGETTADPAEAESWTRIVVWWDVAFYLIVPVSAVAMVTGGLAAGPRRVALGAIAVILLAYTVLGRRVARSRELGPALVYLLVLIAATVTAVTQSNLGTFLLFVAFTHIWLMVERRVVAIALVVLLAAGSTVALISLDGFTAAATRQIVPQMAAVMVFSIGLGLWVAHTMHQTEVHAALVDELRATQSALAGSHHEAGVVAERERMAREIHDTLAQGFISVVVHAQGAETDLRRGDTDAAVEQLGVIERTARDNLAEARALVAAFSPVGLDGSTLREALARLAERFSTETGITVDLDLDLDAAGTLGREQEVILLRTAQEALSNVRRHAHARRVQLVLRGPGDSVRLEVADDGRGIDTAATEGIGLQGMRERVRSGGGELDVSSEAGAGTRVHVSLPTAQRKDRG